MFELHNDARPTGLFVALVIVVFILNFTKTQGGSHHLAIRSLGMILKSFTEEFGQIPLPWALSGFAVFLVEDEIVVVKRLPLHLWRDGYRAYSLRCRTLFCLTGLCVGLAALLGQIVVVQPVIESATGTFLT